MLNIKTLLLTGKSASKVSQAAWRTDLVGYIGPPGQVKLYKQVFSRVLVVILSSKPRAITYCQCIHTCENHEHGDLKEVGSP